jgi:hypothetical protein
MVSKQEMCPMSMEELIEGGEMSSIDVLDVDEVIGTLGCDAVDPNAETVRMKRPQGLELLARQLEALYDETPIVEKHLFPLT